MDLRLFVALELPPSWCDALSSLQDELRRQGLARLRWVRPESAHLTLRFLGAVAEERLPEVAAATARAARRYRPLALTLDAPGVFGPPARPRVLWAGVGGDVQALTRLAGAIEREMIALGFPAERTHFTPHLTLARTPDNMPPALATAIPAALRRVAAPSAPPFLAEEVAVMRSELGRGGARYTRVAVARFSEDPAPEATRG